jgi:SprT protein
MRAYDDALQWLMERPEQVHALEQLVADLERRAARQAGLPARAPRLAFDLRGTLAGSVNRAGVIRLNPVLLRENLTAFMAQTLPHEVAHWVVFRWRPRAAPHGPEWRRVMAWLGAPARRCHDFDVARARTRTMSSHRYRCACQSHDVSAIRHRRMQSGTIYRCRTCAGELRPGADTP